MPDQQPTIWDILGYEQDSQFGMWDEEGNEYFPDQLRGRGGEYAEGVIPEGVTEGRRGGQADMMSYLSDLYLKSTGEDIINRDEGQFGVDLGNLGTWGQEYEQDIFEEFLSTIGDRDFRNMSEEDMKGWISGYRISDEMGGRRAGTGFGSQYKEGTEEMDMLNYLKTFQEGFKATPTSESFGLGRKIGDIETTGKRELKSAREGYIPGEILSRYGALQGKAGAQQKGEQLEQAYTEDIYGVQRGMARDTRSTYEDFEDEWFSGVESWMSNLG